MKAIAQIGNTIIAVRPLNSHSQEILIQATTLGERMAHLLSENAHPEQVEGCEFFVIPHDEEADGRIKEIIDALVTIRYAHPHYVQLVLLAPKEVPL